MRLTIDQMRELADLADAWLNADATQREILRESAVARGPAFSQAFQAMVSQLTLADAPTVLPAISHAMRSEALLASVLQSDATQHFDDSPSSDGRERTVWGDGGALARPSGRATHPERVGGQRIGPYRLIKELGRGGMGVVWLAERADGQHTRQVALKMPLVENLNWLLAARFARERNILASLEHPGIARLYDAGVDEEVQPYIAIEYVVGQAINAHVQAQRLRPDAIVALFIRVIDAVAHAHAHLVIHRDIKPGNILVDEKGQPHLLDFGIAKLLDDEDTDSVDATQLTRIAGRALTLDYASPEQVNAQALGTASDIYSLGVVLYELLTGVKPYRPDGGTRRDLERAILEQEPTRPSDRLQLSGTSGASRSARQVRGDLDTIVLKALKKEPRDRYATAQAFADDLRRYLAYEPIAAKPDNGWYRMRKFVRRNRVMVAAAAAVLATASVGFVTTMQQAERAEREAVRANSEATQKRQEALRATGAAEEARAQAKNATAQTLLAELASQQAREQTALATHASQVANAASRAAELASVDAARQRDVAAQERDDAARSADLARVEAKRSSVISKFLTNVFLSTSVYQTDPGAAQQKRAIDLLHAGAERILVDLKDEPAARNRLLWDLAQLYQGLGDYERAEPLAKAWFDAATAVDTAEQRLERFEAGVLLGSIRYGAGKTDAQLEVLDAIAPLLADVARSKPEAPPGYYVILGAGLVNRSLSEAIVALEKGVNGMRTFASKSAEDETNFVHSARLLATVLGRTGDYERADTLLAEIIDRTRRSGGAGSATLGSLYAAQGHNLRNAGRFGAAVKAYDMARQNYEAVNLPNLGGWRSLNAGRAKAHAALGDWRQVEALSADVLQRFQKLSAPGDDLLTERIELAIARARSGEWTRECGVMQSAFKDAEGKSHHRALVRAFASQAVEVCTLSGGPRQLEFARALLLARASHADLGTSGGNPRVAVPYVIAQSALDLVDSRPDTAYARLSALIENRSGDKRRSHSVWFDAVPWFGRAAAETGHIDACRSTIEAAVSEVLSGDELRQRRPLLAELYSGLAICSFRGGDRVAARKHIDAAIAIRLETETTSSEALQRARLLERQLLGAPSQ